MKSLLYRNVRKSIDPRETEKSCTCYNEMDNYNVNYIFGLFSEITKEDRERRRVKDKEETNIKTKKFSLSARKTHLATLSIVCNFPYIIC